MQLSYNEIQFLKRRVISQFQVCDGRITVIEPVDSGRINTTYKVVIDHGDDTTSYMLQRLNGVVFHNIEGIMKNALLITNHLRAKGKETLEFVPVKENTSYLIKIDGEYYRMTKFIHAEVFQSITRPEDMQMLGLAVGDFAMGLSDFNARELIDTIPHFHNTEQRYINCLKSAINYQYKFMEKSVYESSENRFIKAESAFKIINSFSACINKIDDALKKRAIPYRVTHNDTKLNNVLFDRKTLEYRCLIDLDTVMKGTVLHDIADAIRYGANTCSEEEKDFEKVDINLELVEEFLIGFHKSAQDLLTKKEIELMPTAIMLMPLELGMRFLTDYLENDIYFGASYDNQNLVRAMVQLTLAKRVSSKIKDIDEIVQSIFIP